MILSPLIIIKANYFKLHSIRLVVCVRQFTDRQSIICDKKPQLHFFKLPKYRKYGILYYQICLLSAALMMKK